MAAKNRHMSYFHVFAHMMTGGRAYAGDATSPAGFLKLTTTGRKSGQPRTVTLLFTRDGPDYVVAASNAGRPQHPGWYFNLQRTPQVAVHAHRRDFPAVAQVAAPEERRTLWARLIEIAPFYAGYERQGSREIPMVRLTPTK